MGEDKGRARRGKRTQIGGQFSWRLIDMQRSPAFRALSLSGHRILARLEIELASHGGDDNGKLPTTFDQFEEYGVHRMAIAPAIREVVALGFVEVTERGRAGNAEWRRPNVYRLTYRPTRLTEPTDDWRSIDTREHAELVASAARKASDKTNPQYRKPYHTSVRKPHLSEPFHSTETVGTSHSTETVGTSISRDQSPGDVGKVSDALLRTLKRKGLAS
ncbi:MULTISPECIES: hypothetical protein [Mesorhizobium]|uniref:hypothetical protein n=1 Tax=Mesorhizobium TaxID=68287 RepID=UPI0003CE9664|nr:MULTISPECIES: hypothetical protein [Mesorhizobium]ESY69601.1 hypothetical protein X742_05650 [Mesorhizobium sp. LNHC232B00]WJI40281.1 hypothetical protein NL534_08585 [Mesorhizobium opportunistum]